MKKALLVVAALAVALVAAELAGRVLDGYELTSLGLHRPQTSRPAIEPPPSADATYMSQIPLAPGMDRAWYALEPEPRTVMPRDPDLERRAVRYPSDPLSTYFAFNRQYLRQQFCGPSRGSALPPYHDFFYFDPLDGAPYPTYRHLPHVHPAGVFVSNNFGWRGHDVALNRPANVIRIAFVGASTTIDGYGVRFSHPELVEFWLNKWAAASGRPYSFEVINAGRSGIDSRSIAAVVRQELVPVDPDLVVFYEGANQFWPGQLMKVSLGRLFPKPTRTFRRRLAAEDYSVLVRRTLSLIDRLSGGDGREPIKPPYVLNWPADVDERDPDLSARDLPMDLDEVIADLDRMRQALAPGRGDLAVSSFVWLVHPGLQLDLKRHLPIYRYLNDSYWPITYALMRRMADFQNRVFAKYARVNGLPFFDVAALSPQDPDLFDDGIHMNYAGIKLQAWIFVQSLVRVVLARTQAGVWPRAPVRPKTVHPAFNQPERRLVTRAELQASCS